jgi:hypothetical protein
VSEPPRFDLRSRILAEHEGKSYVALAIDPRVVFVPPPVGEPFPCLLWDHDGRATGEQRAALARALLTAGCRYFVCAGQNCEAWHDAADDEFLARNCHEPETVPDIDYVMTSWHDGESVDDVAFFFVNCTNLHGHDFASFLVLHIGEGPDRGTIEAAVRREALDP